MKNYLILAVCTVIIGAAMYTYANKPSVTLTLRSDSFKNGGPIPRQYTCQGSNRSPELEWKASSTTGIKSYVLIVDDPDAQPVVGKTYVHWIILLNSNTTKLPEEHSWKDNPSTLGIELLNDAKIKAYSGPCPPKDTGVHTYRFTLFAVSETSQQLQANPQFPKPPFTADEFTQALSDIIVAEARITGTYGNKK